MTSELIEAAVGEIIGEVIAIDRYADFRHPIWLLLSAVDYVRGWVFEGQSFGCLHAYVDIELLGPLLVVIEPSLQLRLRGPLWPVRDEVVGTDGLRRHFWNLVMAAGSVEIVRLGTTYGPIVAAEGWEAVERAFGERYKGGD